ncbi:MAG: hypothetical protein R6W99_04480 [Clostridia bacterium]
MDDNCQRRVITFTSDSMAEFEEKARRAKSLGATHVTVSAIEKSRWQWERDLSDPYPNWGMLIAALFKVVVPEELSEWLPSDYAQRNLKLIEKRGEILKKLGLKGAFQMKEPCYLPEEVYRAHPEWRGPRCDHPRRARNYYYSPCIDRPEILAMYSQAMEKLCGTADIDYFNILTNDSGGGICWSSGLYPGKNGPEWCRTRPQSERVRGFLLALKEGAARAGADVWLDINSNIGIKEPEHEMDAMWPFLPDHQAVNKKTNTGRPLASEVFLNWEYTLQPVKNIARPYEFLEQYEKAYFSGLPVSIVTMDDSDFDEHYLLMERFNLSPQRGVAARAAMVHQLAADIAGDPNASLLAEAWQKTEKGILHYLDTGLEGLVSCCVNQRWLNRPFVLFPGELAHEEKEYYRRFQFQANDEAHADDLLDIQNSSFIRGYSGVFIASMALRKAIGLFSEAVALLKRVAETMEGGPRDRMLLYADRIELLSCFMKNARNAIRFQHIIDTADYDRVPDISPEWPLDAEPPLLRYEEITRAEIDNTHSIIRLIEGRETTMLSIAKTHELEDVFLFSPRLASQLSTKTEIMMNRLLDGKRLFVTPNK